MSLVRGVVELGGAMPLATVLARTERPRRCSGGETLRPLCPRPASSQVSDFGLSKWMEQSTRMQYIERSALRGTLSYIPPEMFLDSNKAPGPKYDVYR